MLGWNHYSQCQMRATGRAKGRQRKCASHEPSGGPLMALFRRAIAVLLVLQALQPHDAPLGHHSQGPTWTVLMHLWVEMASVGHQAKRLSKPDHQSLCTNQQARQPPSGALPTPGPGNMRRWGAQDQSRAGVGAAAFCPLSALQLLSSPSLPVAAWPLNLGAERLGSAAGPSAAAGLLVPCLCLEHQMGLLAAQGTEASAPAPPRPAA
mmetsp:Transcript_12357/g.33730  ORF Transcript_12357/g.33730 Transcript_12357/m.33730 type:complete len:208 (+) Transcript_12357:43-666(+)